jgi:hypothetical protein
MSEIIKKNVTGADNDGEGIIGFSVDDLLESIWTPPSETDKNSSYPSTVFGPVEAARACTYIPD